MIEISKDHVINGKLESIERTVTPIIEHLNADGFPINIDFVGKIQAHHTVFQEEIAEEIYRLAGSKFNIGKKDQLRVALKSEGFTFGKSANLHVMDGLARKGSKLAVLIKKYRQIQRVSSNGQSLINFYDRFFEELKPTWHQNKALTGRILSEAPCVSNISKPYRAAVREDGCRFLFFDFRNFELRIQASLANDPVLIELFNNDFDLHSFTASLILDKDPDEVAPEERKKYKSISLGYWYGMGVDGIVYRTGLDRKFIRNVTRALDNKFDGLKSHVVSFEKEASEKGVVETPWGRRMAKKANYGFWALLAQATAADYFKYTLVQVAKELPGLVLVAPLFDGGLYKTQGDQRKIGKALESIVEITGQPVEGFCRMSVDVGSGESWQEAVQSSKDSR